MDLSKIEAVSQIVSKKTSVKLISTSKLKINRPRNVRRETAYDLKNPEFRDLVDSVLVHGFIEGNHVTVHDDCDGTFDVLKGHRRVSAVIQAQKEQETFGMARFDLSSVPCIVLSGLSENEKLNILVDIGNVAMLDEIEMLNAVERLIHAGLGREQIAVKLGQKVNWVQRRQQLLALGSEVRQAWIAKKEGKENLPFDTKWENLQALHVAMVTDRKEGINDFSGPAYTTELAKVKNGTTTGKEKKKEGFTPSQIEGMANVCTRHWLRQYLFYLATGKGDSRTILDNLYAAHDAFFTPTESVEAK